MIISIFASIWAQNLWDELILKNEIKLLEKEHWKDVKFIVFSYDYKNPFYKKSNIVYKEYFPVWIKKPSNIFRNIINFFIFINTVIKSDLIIIWWGWIIYNTEKQSTKNPLNQWVFRTNIFRLFRKKVEFFAVWLNIKTNTNDNSVKKVKQIFKKAYKITTRDNYSTNLLKENWIESKIVKDPVFYDNIKWTSLWEKRKKYMIKKVDSNKFNINDLEWIDLNWKKIALAFRQWYLSNKWEKFDKQYEEWKINELINYILKKWGEVILLPHSFHKKDSLANDYKFLSKFLRITEKIRIINSMDEVYSKYIYKEMDLVLAMRLHSIILSQVYEIPYIWVSYSTKTDEVLKQIWDL